MWWSRRPENAVAHRGRRRLGLRLRLRWLLRLRERSLEHRWRDDGLPRFCGHWKVDRLVTISDGCAFASEEVCVWRGVSVTYPRKWVIRDKFSDCRSEATLQQTADRTGYFRQIFPQETTSSRMRKEKYFIGFISLSIMISQYIQIPLPFTGIHFHIPLPTNQD